MARGDVDHAHVEDASDRYVGGHVRVPGDVKIRTGRIGSRDAYAEAGVDHVQCDVRCGADEGRLVGTLKVKEAVGGHFYYEGRLFFKLGKPEWFRMFDTGFAHYAIARIVKWGFMMLSLLAPSVHSLMCNWHLYPNPFAPPV